MPDRVALIEESLDVERVRSAVADPRFGAHVMFTGRVRDHRDRREVTGLFYESYVPMAEVAIRRLIDEIEGRGEPLKAAIHHRLGSVGVGEVSVAIAVAAPHRSAAFEATRELLDRLKREVPIWKREEYADGERSWREEEPLATSGGDA